MPDLEQQIVERLIGFAASCRLRNTPEWMLIFVERLNSACAEIGDATRFEFDGDSIWTRGGTVLAIPLPSPPEPSTQPQGDFPRELVGALIIAAHHASVKLYHACRSKEITRSDKRDYMAVTEEIERAKNSCFDFDDSLTQARQPQTPPTENRK